MTSSSCFWRRLFASGASGGNNSSKGGLERVIIYSTRRPTRLDALYQFFLFFNGFSIDRLLINRYYKIPSIVLKVQRTSRVFSFTDQRKMLHKRPSALALWLSFVVLLRPTLCDDHPDQENEVLTQQVFSALNRAIDFYRRDFKSINLDGIFGLRVAQGKRYLLE